MHIRKLPVKKKNIEKEKEIEIEIEIAQQSRRG